MFKFVTELEHADASCWSRPRSRWSTIQRSLVLNDLLTAREEVKSRGSGRGRGTARCAGPQTSVYRLSSANIRQPYLLTLPTFLRWYPAAVTGGHQGARTIAGSWAMINIAAGRPARRPSASGGDQ